MLSFVVFLNCVCIGVIAAAVDSLFYIVKRIFHNNSIVCITIDFCVYFIGGVVVYLCAHIMNNGIFATYEMVGYIIGIVLTQNTCGNSFAKLIDLVYNNAIKVKNKFKLTRVGNKICK